jgi:hypothetical protein
MRRNGAAVIAEAYADTAVIERFPGRLDGSSG